MSTQRGLWTLITAGIISAAAIIGPCCGTALGQESINAPLALEKAADRLEQLYALPITYEDPQRVWPEEVELLGRLPDGKEVTRIRPHTLTLPSDIAQGSSLTLAQIERLVEDYSGQNPNEPRFRVEESKLGFHIVPSEAHDVHGEFVAAPNPLEATVTVPKAERTASEHLSVLVSAIQAAARVPVILTARSFDEAYVANNYFVPTVKVLPVQARQYMVFEWGAENMQARAALIDLLAGSRTTVSWRLHCSPYLNTQTCFFSPTFLQVGPNRRIVAYDRCTNCQAMPVGK